MTREDGHKADSSGLNYFQGWAVGHAKRGVELKWFGDDEPKAFTSRYDSWRYIDDIPVLPTTLRVLEKTLDMRVPLTFSVDDCDVIAAIIEDEMSQFRSN